MDNLVGQEIGNYRLLRPLVHDRAAAVYFAEHKDDRSWGAVKIVGPSKGTDRRIAQWNAETHLLPSLNHPHVVLLMTYSIEERIPYLVMSYAPGGSLDQLCPRGNRLPCPQGFVASSKTKSRSRDSRRC